MAVTLPAYADVAAAASRLDGVAHRTPVFTSRTLDERLGARVFLKAEHLASESELESLHKAIEREVNEAAERAIASEKPGRETVQLYVFSPDIDPSSRDFEDRKSVV